MRKKDAGYWKQRAEAAEAALKEAAHKIATGRWSRENVLARLSAEHKRKQGLMAGNVRKQLRQLAVRPGIHALARKHLKAGTAPQNVVAKVVRDMRRFFPDLARSKEVTSRILKPLLDPLRAAQRETRSRK